MCIIYVCVCVCIYIHITQAIPALLKHLPFYKHAVIFLIFRKSGAYVISPSNSCTIS